MHKTLSRSMDAIGLVRLFVVDAAPLQRGGCVHTRGGRGCWLLCLWAPIALGATRSTRAPQCFSTCASGHRRARVRPPPHDVPSTPRLRSRHPPTLCALIYGDTEIASERFTHYCSVVSISLAPTIATITGKRMLAAAHALRNYERDGGVKRFDRVGRGCCHSTDIDDRQCRSRL